MISTNASVYEKRDRIWALKPKTLKQGDFENEIYKNDYSEYMN